MNLPITIFVVLLLAIIIIGFATGKIRNRIPFKRWLMLIVEDHKMPFTKTGRAEIKRSAHQKHYFRSEYIIAILMLSGQSIDHYFETDYFQVQDVGFFGCVIMGWLFAIAGNFVREWYYSEFKGKKWEFRDIRFGGYGGRDGAIIAYLIISLIF